MVPDDRRHARKAEPERAATGSAASADAAEPQRPPDRSRAPGPESARSLEGVAAVQLRIVMSQCTSASTASCPVTAISCAAGSRTPFVDAWDAWLREGLAASRTALGLSWLDVYLTSPAWRFVCAAGACGPAPVIGLLAPSVDQVGRYFPLTVVAQLPEDVCLVTAATHRAGSSTAAERLVIETLAAEPSTSTGSTRAWRRWSRNSRDVERAAPIVLEPAAASVSRGKPAGLADCRWATSYHLPSAFEQLLSLQLEAKYRPLVLWWTDGSSVSSRAGSCLKGLPGPRCIPPSSKARGPQRGWRSAPVHVPGRPRSPTIARARSRRCRFRSVRRRQPTWAARGPTTRTASSNGPRSACGWWPTGWAGTVDGEVASRMVCDALADFQVGSGPSRKPSTPRLGALQRGERPPASQLDAVASGRSQRQHRRRPVAARGALRGVVGGRQPGVPVAGRAARTAEPGSQPGRPADRGGGIAA